MRRFLIASVIAVLLLFVGTSMNALPEKQKDISPKPTAALPVYSESEDGLRSLIGDIFGAMKSGEKDLASSYFASLEIPDRAGWFTKAFGPVEGPRLEAKHEVAPPAAKWRHPSTFRICAKRRKDQCRSTRVA